MSTGDVQHKDYPVLMLFNHVPSVGGSDRCNTFFFLPRKRMQAHYLKIPYTLIIMKNFLGADVAMLNKIRFWPRLTEEDVGLNMFINTVNRNGYFAPEAQVSGDEYCFDVKDKNI